MRQSIYLLDRHRRSLEDITTNFLRAPPNNSSSASRCNACGSPLGMRHWEPPFRIELETWGTSFGDLAFGPGDEFLVSERFASCWKGEGLVGLQGFEPVEIVKVRHRGKRIKDAPPQYLSVRAANSDVAVEPVESGIQWITPPACNVCRVGTMNAQERIVLEGESKENIFFARGLPGEVLVDERFKRFCEEHAITNCFLIPAEQASYSA